MLAELERELQRLSDDRRARDVEGVADLLRLLGTAERTAEAVERGATPAWLAGLEEARRAIRVRVAGEEHRAVGRGPRSGAAVVAGLGRGGPRHERAREQCDERQRRGPAGCLPLNKIAIPAWVVGRG